MLSLTLLSGAVLSAPKASADTSGTVDITVNVPAACTLSATNNTLTKTINPGTSDTIGISNIKALCNDANGFAIYAVGFTDSTYGNTDLVTDLGSNYSIHTGTDTSASNWNMTIDNDDVANDHVATIENDFDEAHIIPTTYTKIASFASATDQSIGSNITAQFDAYIAPNQAAGTYQGKVKFVLVHPTSAETPCPPNNICYMANGADEGSMAHQTSIDDGTTAGFNTYIASGSEVTLHASNFSRAGYGFTGWNTKEDGTGTQYGPMQTITFTEDMSTNGLVLFANWRAAETGVTMQTFDTSASPYSTMSNGSIIALKDARDNDVYAVAKLADGNWWMIENLRLDSDANITPSNTQSNNGAFGGVFTGLAQSETYFSSSARANSLYTADTTSTNLRIIAGNNQSSRIPRYNNNNTTSRTSNNSTSDANVYSYGNYYTWSAAVADTGDYATSNQSITNTSLCPTGWHLPKGGDKSNESNNEWWNLVINVMNGTKPSNYESNSFLQYTSNSPEGVTASKAIRSFPNNLLFSGIQGTSSARRGTFGSYWSSTNFGTQYAYDECFANNYLSTFIDAKYDGHAVRCLAD